MMLIDMRRDDMPETMTKGDPNGHCTVVKIPSSACITMLTSSAWQWLEKRVGSMAW